MQVIKGEKLTLTKTRPLWYSESLASSLIHYAKENNDFARRLWELIRRLLEVKKTGIKTELREDAKILMPSDPDTAWRRAEWLIKNISENNLPGSESARAIFTSWVGDKPIDTPKKIIIGIAVGAILGPTLGYIKKRKVMNILINEKLATRPSYKLTEKISAATHGVLVSSLEMVNGNVHKLEPDLADWFFGDRELKFFSINPARLEYIGKELKSLGIVYSMVESEGEPAVLAISPAVNSVQAEADWGLDQMEV